MDILQLNFLLIFRFRDCVFYNKNWEILSRK